jgi:hypothetical protein
MVNNVRLGRWRKQGSKDSLSSGGIEGVQTHERRWRWSRSEKVVRYGGSTGAARERLREASPVTGRQPGPNGFGRTVREREPELAVIRIFVAA